MSDATLQIWLNFVEFLLGTVAIGVISAVINYSIQRRKIKQQETEARREIELKELEQLGQFVEHALSDRLVIRERFATYFATVVTSPEARNRWNDYRKILDEERAANELRYAALANAVEKPTLDEQQAAEARQEIKRLKAELENVPKAAISVGHAIDEMALVDLLHYFVDQTYSIGNARYPFQLPGVTVPLTPPMTINNTIFVEALLVRAWSNGLGSGFRWSTKLHMRMMIASTDDYFSPITAIIDSGIGAELPVSEDPPSSWAAVQGWRNKWLGGQTFLILASHEETGRVLTLEENKAHGIDGVGFRGLGNIRDFQDMNPGPEWWRRDGLWTWARLRETYPFMKMARLNVMEPRWISTSTIGKVQD